jgi:lysophospholipase L1-like esterase
MQNLFFKASVSWRILVLVLAFFLLNLSYSALAQRPFQNEIDQFKKQDQVSPPTAGQILLVGSSSFRRWTNVQGRFPGYPILNRGFGGSTLPDVIGFAQDIIIPYHPKQVAIYCGENDLAADSTINGKTIFKRFRHCPKLSGAVCLVVRLFVAAKPSPSRARVLDKVIDANARISRYCRKHKNYAFADVFTPMLGPTTNLWKICSGDMLHMNEKGYDIWTWVIQPYLLK